MYILDAFNNRDESQVFDFISQYSFADLISQHQGQIFSNKFPFLLHPKEKTLFGHMGAGNPQLQQLTRNHEVLVVFSGPHAYVSPRWYVSEGMVPTWNFQTAQVRGILSILDQDELEQGLAEMTAKYEQKNRQPWQMDELDDEQRERLLSYIVGFRINIHSWAFKEKLSQNRTTNDRKSVADHLNQEQDPQAKLIARRMKQLL